MINICCTATHDAPRSFLLVFTFAAWKKENTLIWSSKNIVCPLCSNKTISPDLRQKPSYLWCGKNLLVCGTVKTSLPVVRQKPLACVAAEAFLPVVRPAAKAFLPVVRPAARTSSLPSLLINNNNNWRLVLALYKNRTRN